MEHSRKMKANLLIVFTLLVSISLLTPQNSRGDDTSKLHDDMRVLYHDLDMANQKAKREYKVSIELADMETAYDLCIAKAAELDACRKQTSALEDKLHTRIHDAQMLAEERKQTEILRQQAEASKTPATNNVTIIDNSSNDEYWRHHHHHHQGWRREKEELPGPTPPPVRLDFHQKF